MEKNLPTLSLSLFLPHTSSKNPNNFKENYSMILQNKARFDLIIRVLLGCGFVIYR